MNFSLCLITRNEVKTLPCLIQSLNEFQKKGGAICIFYSFDAVLEKS